MDQDFFNNVFKKVEGFLLDEEARYLYALGLEGKVPGVVLEIGSWKGKSTVLFAHASKRKTLGKVYAVDPHTGSPEHGQVWTFPEFERNVKFAGVEDAVVSIVKTSEAAVQGWKEPIRLLWIDGNHDYAHAKSDFVLWSPFLVPGGAVAFHDTVLGDDVKRVVKESLFFSPHYKKIRFIGTIVSAEKARSPALFNLIPNFFAYLLWELYGLYSKKAFKTPSWIKAPLKAVIKSKLADNADGK